MWGTLREGGRGREVARDLVASLASTKFGLRALNAIYDKTGDRSKHRFYLLFGNIFINRPNSVYCDDWCVTVPGGELKIPLGKDETWLDWGMAVSLLGHDQEVKQTYAAIVSSGERPAQFIDVGANYGSHSLLLHTSGVPTLSFEPNPGCVTYLKRWAAANDISPDIEQVALGDGCGDVSFDFPIKATWLGMISDKEELPEGYQRITVPLRRLDDYMDRLAPGPLLIKLDAEGAEPAIIRGSVRLITERCPMIIFECWEDPTARQELVDAFAGRFEFYSLPWSPIGNSPPMNSAEFVRASGTNFIAVPRAVAV